MEDIPNAACRGFLHRNRFGVMALAEGGRAYAIPLFYAYDGQRLYFQSHPGLKDEYMAACTEACFVVVEVTGDDDWKSVQATGPVEKITLTDDAFKAMDALAKNPFPPDFGADEAGRPKRSAEKMYLWMMQPRSITGRKSVGK